MSGSFDGRPVADDAQTPLVDIEQPVAWQCDREGFILTLGEDVRTLRWNERSLSWEFCAALPLAQVVDIIIPFDGRRELERKSDWGSMDAAARETQGAALQKAADLMRDAGS